MKVAFIHPDLGIGGAERLVVDAAVGLQEKNHEITMITSHCDRSHCFEEIKDETLEVEVYGDFLPTKILNKFAILCSIMRQFYLTIRLIVTGEISNYDLFIVDQLSFCIPLLHFYKNPKAKVLFYCHHPDLLAASHGSFLRALYRKPFDFIEELSTGYSDNIVVNSLYTKSIFLRTFKNLSNLNPSVVYPCVPTEVSLSKDAIEEVEEFFGPNEYLLSINRFDKPKNIELAINAFKEFLDQNPSTRNVKLVIAGGFDPRNWKNVQYLIELEELCKSNSLISFTFRGRLVQMPRSVQVLFMPSISSQIKDALILRTKLLLYTPLLEHFGIVPLEGMRLAKPVLAVNFGGPLESVVEGETGYLRDPSPKEWAKIYEKVLMEENANYGKGIDVVRDKFSRDSMTIELLKSINQTQVKYFKFDWFWLLFKKSMISLVIGIVVISFRYKDI